MESLAILAVLGVPALIALMSIWRGFVAVKLWAWFVVPQFGLAPLPIAIAIGLSLLVSLPTPTRVHSSEEDSKQEARNLITALLSPALALLMGWIVFSIHTA